ncbi:MAG: TolC family protein [Planctomycetota bacterium]
MRNFLFIVLLLSLAVGCSRRTYRLWADRDAQCVIEDRQFDSTWQIPSRPVEASVASRMHDFTDPDTPCIRPMDDQGASKYMLKSYCFRGSKYWDRFSEAGEIEQLHWCDYLPLNDEGNCQVDRQSAVELALLHNRNYQSSYEQLYLNALNLSLNRYDFHSRWFGGSGGTFDASGDGMLASRLLGNGNSLGFSRNLVGGGQFVTNLINSLTWQLGGGPNSQTVSTNLVFMLTQPLLRGAFRHVRMESLTQAERSLLYGVRDFVRFRRAFYLSTVSQYLNLLTSVQGLKNQRANLEALELNLRETEELLLRDQASPLQVDQVLQQYQQGRLGVLGAEQGLQDSLDDFKFALGLPPEAPLVLDESLLQTFELNDPKLDQLRIDVTATYNQLRQYLPPDEAPNELLEQVLDETAGYLVALEELIPGIEKELKRWAEKLIQEKQSPFLDPDTQTDLRQQDSLLDRISDTLAEIKVDLIEGQKYAQQCQDEFNQQTPVENWRRLQILISQETQDRLNTLFVLQNQIRLFLIELQPFNIDIDFAVETGTANRLDLMNQRGQVTDAFRQVEIAADSLQSELNVSASANVATDPTRTNPVRLDSSAASYQLSMQFDGPLDRFAERNQYRAAQINYQESRRNYMGLEDLIKNDLRSAVRQLRINRLNFQIIRQQLISVTRRVDEAQINLRAPAGDGFSTSRTRDLLEALQDLLDARNGLISSWIDYEISRIRLFVEMEILYLDETGEWVNERYNPRKDRTVESVPFEEEFEEPTKLNELDPGSAPTDPPAIEQLDYFQDTNQ